ncbi:MAG: hypothetical protein A0129_13925 [Limnobacter sp. CACIAM 66H1]|nr:MAG: hypothetical protein A0129_13925 [Limnobacter sp. CACIAM 66H1]
MSRIKWTEKKIAERQKAGYGEGSGSAYNPWLEVFDLSSTGRSRRVWSSKTGRAHHLFSDVEHDIFIAAEWSRSVIDRRIWTDFWRGECLSRVLPHLRGDLGGRAQVLGG